MAKGQRCLSILSPPTIYSYSNTENWEIISPSLCPQLLPVALGATGVSATRNKAPPAQTCSNLFRGRRREAAAEGSAFSCWAGGAGDGGGEEQELEEEEG